MQNKKICIKCTVEKNCAFFFKSSNNSYHNVCKECRKEDYKKKRHELKAKALKATSQKCVKCNYATHPAALQFHHLYGPQKEFSISFGIKNTYAIDQLALELSKCVTLCSCCHRDIHSNIFDAKVLKLFMQR